MGAARVAGLLLAAGASRRLGTPKQLLPDEHGTPLVVRAVRQLIEAGCAPIVVVTGASAERVALALAELPVRLVHNAAHADGMGRSIACGVGALLDDRELADTEAVLIAACDMPSVDSAHLRALMTTSGNGSNRTASRYVSSNGSHDASMMVGIPAVLPRADWLWLSALAGDRGAKPLLSEPATLSVELIRGMFDIDTPADVDAWRANMPPITLTAKPLMPSMIVQSALADMDHEFANTRRMLELVPEAHLDFTPHPKSWKLGKLANHITDFPWWGSTTIQTAGLNFAEPFPPQPPQPTTAAGFVKQFDDRMAVFREALAGVTDEQMLETWTMRNGDAVIMAMPRVGVLRGMVISHMIHHRAQLSIYYRMVGVPLPGLYGPSADEQ